ncbi:MAG: LysM peptidoglycan-binding domain-containing protein, partial [Deltaproteobacteria bacterium]|nr:LysM peptidoglycan-binding domain-containing protein [Deltaproteobacteria bacterium]
MFARRTAPCLLSLALLTQASVSPPARADETHQVLAGETLWEIAQQHDVSVDALREANDLGNSDRILPGQHLHLPTSDGPTPTPPPPPPP